MTQHKASTVNKEEIDKFSAISAQWWDETGQFKPLHQMNPIRLGFIRDSITRHFDIPTTSDKPLEGLKVLDIGCGGGLLSEPMCRLGGDVTGIDASEVAINVAQEHAQQFNLNINYLCATSEELAAKKTRYDVVTALEILEHVDNLDVFVESCCKLVKKGGLLLFSTLNRTPISYVKAIVGAEYVLRWVPQGTHEWSKFITPSELGSSLRQNDFIFKDVQGMEYGPISRNWALSSNLSVNYICSARRA